MNDWTVSDAYSEQKSDLMALELGTKLYETLNRETPLARLIQKQRRTLTRSHGFFIPAIRIRTTTAVEKEYIIRLRGHRVSQVTLRPPLYFSTKAKEGIQGIHPVTQQAGFWNEEEGTSAQDLLLQHLRSVMEMKAPELLTYETTVRWLQQAKSHVPNLVKELEKKGMTPGLLWQVMRRLLARRVPLHPFEELLETVMEYYIIHPPGGHAPPEWSQAHPDDLVKYIAAQKKKRLPQPGQTMAEVRHIKH